MATGRVPLTPFEGACQRPGLWVYQNGPTPGSRGLEQPGRSQSPRPWAPGHLKGDGSGCSDRVQLATHGQVHVAAHWACTPRCVRIFSITGCSRIAAMIFSSPSQFGQGSRSSSNTRLSSRARLNDWLSPDRPSANTRLWPGRTVREARRQQPLANLANAAKDCCRAWPRTFGPGHQESLASGRCRVGRPGAASAAAPALPAAA